MQGFMRIVAPLLDFVYMRGGGRALSRFLTHFRKCIFGQWKESISSNMPIIWTLPVLAAQDSSIRDLVTHSVSDSSFDFNYNNYNDYNDYKDYNNYNDWNYFNNYIDHNDYNDHNY